MRGGGTGGRLRSIFARLPRPRVPGQRASATDGTLAPDGPLLSVIIPVYNVETYLAECLDSLVGQTLQEMELVVVDDGSTDSSPDILAAYAARDPRFVLLQTHSNGGPGAARNRGIAAATGRYITFLDSDDTIPRTAYEQMVETLERTGSDFALGAVRRVRHGKRTVPAWTRNVHTIERLAVTIDDFPDAMQDVIACNRMFRRAFWNERIGLFEEGVAYEDHVPMVAAFLRARTFDVLSAFTYNWRIRENATSMGQQKHRTANLHDRLRAERDALHIIVTEASEQVRAAWLGRVINTDLPVFVPAALVAGDDYRAALRGGCRRLPRPRRTRRPAARPRRPQADHRSGRRRTVGRGGPAHPVRPAQRDPAGDQRGRRESDRHAPVRAGPGPTARDLRARRPPVRADRGGERGALGP